MTEQEWDSCMEYVKGKLQKEVKYYGYYGDAVNERTIEELEGLCSYNEWYQQYGKAIEDKVILYDAWYRSNNE